MTRIEKKQYILSSCDLKIQNMELHRIGSVFLYTDCDLKVSTVRNAAEQKVIILGYAFKMDFAPEVVEADVAIWDGCDLQILTRYWTGRYAVLTDNGFITDAGSMMSAFYSFKNGNWYISSSLALLEKVGITNKIRTSPLNESEWQILPETGFSDVKKLLCTQRICFSKEGISIYPNIWMRDYRNLTTIQKSEKLAELLVNGITNIYYYSGKNLLLALTGGKDSRLVLAALLKAQVPFSAYTAEHDNISSADVKIPKRLAEQFSFPYQYVKRPKRINKEFSEDYESFTAGNAHGEDKLFYSYGQFAVLSKDLVIIRGGFFEAGQTYARSIARADMNFKSDLENYYTNLKNDSLQRSGLDAWFENVKGNPIPYIDIRDRYYIEQRVGGWGSAIEHALTINDFVSVQIANCVEVFSVLLSCNQTERENLALSFEPIKMLNKRLFSEDFNPISGVDTLKRLRLIMKDPVGKFKKLINKLEIKTK